jgi:hypothetical protein
LEILAFWGDADFVLAVVEDYHVLFEDWLTEDYSVVEGFLYVEDYALSVLVFEDQITHRNHYLGAFEPEVQTFPNDLLNILFV